MGRKSVIICDFGAIRAVISHRVKLIIVSIMKESISPQEYRLLATIILAGLFSNSHYYGSQTYLATTAVRLLNKLLTTIDESGEVK